MMGWALALFFIGAIMLSYQERPRTPKWVPATGVLLMIVSAIIALQVES